MKELSIEEKAKRYDEALTKARNIVNSINVGLIGKDSFEAVFPELKESEDERIRKALIRFHKSTIDIDGIKGDEIVSWLEKQAEQKPAWSEDDERTYRELHNLIYSTPYCDSRKELSDWFESIKDRVQPQTKQEWNERDELMFEASISFIKSSPYPYFGDTLRGEISKTEAEDWIKHLKNRVQPQQEWSEEDEKILDRVITNYESGYLPSVEKRDEIIKKLESFKERYTWRPSDEQIEILDMVLSNESIDDNVARILRELKEQLKKLKE